MHAAVLALALICGPTWTAHDFAAYEAWKFALAPAAPLRSAGTYVKAARWPGVW